MSYGFEFKEAAKKFERAASNVKLVIFDVDGVLTDGGMPYFESGEHHKRFNVLDGHGIKQLKAAGLLPVVITGSHARLMRKRLAALGMEEHAQFNVEDKLVAAQRLLAKLGLDWSQVAAIGDDWPDLPNICLAAVTAAPANAHPEVRARAGYVTQSMGGYGAAREFCDLLLHARGHYQQDLASMLARIKAAKP